MMTSSYGWLAVLLGLSVTAAAVRGQASRLNRSAPVPSDANTAAEAEKGSAQRLQSLKWRYLVVMLTVRFADWLQGPYFYELYAKKTDSRTGAQLTAGAVSTLFLVGFCASMAFGTVAGSLTDTFGRCTRDFPQIFQFHYDLCLLRCAGSLDVCFARSFTRWRR